MYAYELQVELEVQRNLGRRTNKIEMKNIFMQAWESTLWYGNQVPSCVMECSSI